MHLSGLCCESCSYERLVAINYKRRGNCTSRGVRCMVKTDALLVDNLRQHRAVRKWVLRFSLPFRFELANHPQVMVNVLANVNPAFLLLSWFSVHYSCSG